MNTNDIRTHSDDQIVLSLLAMIDGMYEVIDDAEVAIGMLNDRGCVMCHAESKRVVEGSRVEHVTEHAPGCTYIALWNLLDQHDDYERAANELRFRIGDRQGPRKGDGMKVRSKAQNMAETEAAVGYLVESYKISRTEAKAIIKRHLSGIRTDQGHHAFQAFWGVSVGQVEAQNEAGFEMWDADPRFPNSAAGRDVYMKTTCPVCDQEPGHRCVKASGAEAHQNHKGRIDAWLAPKEAN